MTAQIVGDDENVPSRVVGFDGASATQCSSWNYAQRHIWSTLCHHGPARPRRSRPFPRLGCTPTVP
jgi:hypothetical protein